MFWKKKNDTIVAEKGPQEAPSNVQQYLVNNLHIDPDYARLFKSVVRKGDNGASSIRLFDESDAQANHIKITGYSSLDSYPELVIFEGSINDSNKTVTLEEKNRFSWDTKIYTEKEILQQIDSMQQAGAEVLFYQTRGGQVGGPLGRGMDIIQMNPDYPGKGQKKYNIFVADVVKMQPVNKNKLFSSNNPKEIAHWVFEGHAKRQYS